MLILEYRGTNTSKPHCAPGSPGPSFRLQHYKCLNCAKFCILNVHTCTAPNGLMRYKRICVWRCSGDGGGWLKCKNQLNMKVAGCKVTV